MQAIQALGSVLEPGKLLVVTAGLMRGVPGHLRTEDDPPAESTAVPRRPEQAAQEVAASGVHVAIVRLPQVHDRRKQGLVTTLIEIAKEKGRSTYVGQGANRWAAAPLSDVKQLYRLVIEKTGPGLTTYHAVQEEGVALRQITETLGQGLNLPVVSIPAEAAVEHLGPFLGIVAAIDLPASSQWTRTTLGWDPTAPGLIENLTKMNF